jgi:hypothetical protein
MELKLERHTTDKETGKISHELFGLTEEERIEE